MEVVFDTDVHMYLDHGSKKFVRAYDLRHGHFLVFRYNDNAMFTMKKSSSDSGYNKSSKEDEEEQSGEEEERSGDEEVQPILFDDDLAMVVAHDGPAMVVPDDDLAMVVIEDGLAMGVPDDYLLMVVVPDDGLVMVIPQPGDRTMPIVVEEYIPQRGPRPILGLRRSKRIRMMKEKEKKQE
ncbi:B3 domain-containing protein [Hordeum vulgare]|nr:B3 domain-containing protein [Hordeum vulgare]